MGFVIGKAKIFHIVELNRISTFGNAFENDGFGVVGIEDVLNDHSLLKDVLAKPLEFEAVEDVDTTGNKNVVGSQMTLFHADEQFPVYQRDNAFPVAVELVEAVREGKDEGIVILVNVDGSDNGVLNEKRQGDAFSMDSSKWTNHN